MFTFLLVMAVLIGLSMATYLDPRQSLRSMIAAMLGRGNEWYVDSVNGASGNNGKSWGSAVATIAAAQTLASAGDKIFVAEGHAETISAAGGITLSTAGLRIIGTGYGTRKPTLTFATLTTATLLISGANIFFSGFRFVNAIDSLVKFVDVNADYFTIEDCDFVGASTVEVLSFINIRTTKDFLAIRRCTARQPTDPAGTDGGADTGFLYCVDTENIVVEDCDLSGMFETAIFHNRTTKCRNLVVKNCFGNQLLSGAEPFQLVADVDGGAWGGMFLTPAETAVTEATLVGTIGDKFFISPTCTFGNDGAAGGQGGIVVATAS